MDRKTVIEGLTHCMNGFGCFGCPYSVANKSSPDCQLKNGRDALALLKEQPEIVHCKDCKHRPTQKKCFPDTVCPCQCSDSYYSWVPPDDWYCADGERKEGEQDG